MSQRKRRKRTAPTYVRSSTVSGALRRAIQDEILRGLLIQQEFAPSGQTFKEPL